MKLLWLLLLYFVGYLFQIVRCQVTSTGCGTTKGCFRDPPTCTDGSDCNFLATWNTKQDGSNVFTITGSTASTYIALGFSTSSSMASTDVYACTSNNVVVRSRNTNGKKNDKSPTLKGVSDVSVTQMNGRIECTFTRQASLSDGDSTFYDLSGSNTYYVLMAKSNTGDLQTDGNIAQHDLRVAGTALTSFTGYPLSDMPPSGTTAPPNGMPTNPPGSAPITSEGCGTTKGCFRSPEACTDGVICDFFVSWVADQAGTITFSMTGSSSGTYIALGFSTSSSMADSDVYACTSNNEMVRSRNTNGRTNDPTPSLKGVSSVGMTMVDGRIECTFTRQASLSDGDSTFFDLSGSNTYYIIMAKSNTGDLMTDGSGNIAKHDAKIADSVLTSFQDIVQMPPATTTPGIPMTAPPGYIPITTDGCGTTKGCFRSPEACTDGTNCDFFVSWMPDPAGTNMFEITGSSSGTYIALGFSTSSSMDDSDVYACTSNSEMVRSRNGGSKSNDPSPQLKGVSDASVTIINGRIECTFTRQASLSDGDSTFFDLSGSNRYYVIMSKSNTGDLLQDGNIDYHDSRIADSVLTSFQQIVQMPPPVITTTPGMPMTAPPDYTPITSDGCGTTKGCFRSPEACTDGTNCDFFVSWVADQAGTITFSITGTSSGTYIALGFSTSRSMADSDVYACTSNNELVRSRNTNGRTNDPTPSLKGVSDTYVTIINGRIECTFTRQASLSDGDSTFFDLSDSNRYYVIMSKSNTGDLAQDGNIDYHDSRIADSVLTSFQQIVQMPPPVITTTPGMPMTAPPDYTPITSEGCGTTKGCFHSPEACTDGTNCDFFVSWLANPAGTITFSMTGTSSGTYIALGFSTSSSMADSDVYACTSNNEMVRSRNTNGRTNDPTPSLKGVSDTSVTVINGRIECTFTRQASLSDGDSTFFDLSDSNRYYVIMSKSNTGDLAQDGNIDYHDSRIADSVLTSFQQIVQMPPPVITTTPGMPMTAPPDYTPITSEGCGTTKGCFRSPEACTDGTNCDFFVSWIADQAGTITFSMTGTSSGTYIALGFSTSSSMADSDVYACTSNNEMVRSRNTNGRTNDPTPSLKGVSDTSVTVINGRIECTFTRQASLSDGDSTFFDLSGSNRYYVIMSKSNTGDLLQDGNIDYHDNKIAGATLTSFQEVVQMPPPVSTTTPGAPMTAPSGYTPITSDGCGTTKGCFRSPEACTDGTNCDFFVSWVPDQAGTIMFEVTGSNTGTYIALGFSTSSSMADADVFACTSNNVVVRSQNAIYGQTNHPATLKGVSDVSVTQLNGRIECTFTRQASLSDGDSTFFDIGGSNRYYVIMSKSNTGDLLQDGNIDYHDAQTKDTALTSFQEIVQMPPEVPSTPEVTYPPGETPPPTKISVDGCGTTKGCFRRPSDCTGLSDCDFFVSWTSDQTAGTNTFTMTGKQAASYIALAFSKTGLMADSDVYACTMNNEVVRSYNTMDEVNHINDPSPSLIGVSDVSVSIINGQIECEFTRQASMSVRRRRRQSPDETYFDLSEGNTYYVIMAKSNNPLGADGNINYHVARDFASQPTSFIVDATATQGPTMTSIPATNPGLRNKITTEGCGVTKGCFRQPSSCTGASDCEYFVSWTADNLGNNVFSMTGSATGSYVALGFSKSGLMADSDVYACTSRREVVRSRNTVGNSNDHTLELIGVSEQIVAIVDGQIECEFTRQAFIDGDDTYYDLSGNNSYYIIMAKASSNGLRPDGNILQHRDRTLTSSQQSFSEFSEAIVGANSKLLLQKVHGCLMIIAWLVLASIGITMARYYKPLAPGKEICDKPIWFATHRMVMVLAFVITVAAFIIIFISAGGFVDKLQGPGPDTRYWHAIIGTIVTFLAITNPIMAMFRCHPGTPKRPIFDWAHWAVGTSAHILGIITICLAVAGLGSATPILSGLPSYLFYVVLVFIAVHIALWLFLECHKCMKSSKSTPDIPMTTTNGQDGGQPAKIYPNLDAVDDPNGDPSVSQQQLAPTPEKKSTTHAMNMALGLYITVILVLSAIMIITIAITK